MLKSDVSVIREVDAIEIERIQVVPIFNVGGVYTQHSVDPYHIFSITLPIGIVFHERLIGVPLIFFRKNRARRMIDRNSPIGNAAIITNVGPCIII
ncbi:hypothetical protein D3C73_795400 [compost metagenome]